MMSSEVVKPSFEVDGSMTRTTLMLRLSKDGLVNSKLIEMLSLQGFKPKEEFHVTVFDVNPGFETARLVHRLDAANRTAVFNFLRKTAEESKWEVSLKDEFYALEKQYMDETVARKSVIQMVGCSALDGFNASLNNLLPEGIVIEAPPAHITIATQGNSHGVGIRNSSDLQRYGQPLTIKQIDAGL
jgi:hypothetical protein